MKIEQHVMLSIDDFESGKIESALMHACVAMDGTARNFYNKNRSSKQDYKNCLRQYWWLIERFIGDGFNLEETKWNHVVLHDGHGKKINNPDLVDIIYHIFRCSHAHAEEVPLKYALLPVFDGHSQWFMDFKEGSLNMPNRVIWALLAVSVFSKANAGIKTENGYYLTWGSETLGIGIEKFVIKDWWAREDDVKNFLSKFEPLRMKMII